MTEIADLTAGHDLAILCYNELLADKFFHLLERDKDLRILITRLDFGDLAPETVPASWVDERIEAFAQIACAVRVAIDLNPRSWGPAMKENWLIVRDVMHDLRKDGFKGPLKKREYALAIYSAFDDIFGVEY